MEDEVKSKATTEVNTTWEEIRDLVLDDDEKDKAACTLLNEYYPSCKIQRESGTVHHKQGSVPIDNVRLCDVINLEFYSLRWVWNMR